jgi:4-hydroxy-tetrahydrodipicolinate synthase
MAEGGDGVVSVTSNVVPKLASRVVELYDEGDVEGAREIAHQLAAWTSAAFVESNPIPVKAALAMMGKTANVLRLPLVPMAESNNEVVRSALRKAGALA